MQSVSFPKSAEHLACNGSAAGGDDDCAAAATAATAHHAAASHHRPAAMLAAGLAQSSFLPIWLIELWIGEEGAGVRSPMATWLEDGGEMKAAWAAGRRL